jgi:Flp pilus assembly protein TadG
MKHLLALFRDKEGTATIEFALASLFMFSIILVGLDFAYAAQQKMRLGGAVEQAAVLAYNQQTGTSTSAISNYVTTAAGTSVTPTVSIKCNGTSTCGDGKCSCITSSGGFSIVASCNSACTASSAISGNYMQIAATVNYTSMIVPDKYLGGTSFTSTAVVRLQ